MILESPTLLITDDDRDFRETIREVFEPRGFSTYLAGDGVQALEIVKRNEIHLVLMDMHMPQLTGIETINRIRRLRQRLPCILISGRLDDDIRSRAKDSTFNVLSKPVSFQEITSTVNDALHQTYGWTGPASGN